MSAFIEISLCVSLSRSKLFGSGIALAYFIISALSPGMSHASVSYLPSSFAMHLFTLSLTCLVEYLSAETNRARNKVISFGLFAIVVGGVLGWPFVLVLAPPWALHYLYITVTAPPPAVEEKKTIEEKKSIEETPALDLTPYRAFFSSVLNVTKASLILIAIIVGIDAIAYREIEFVPLNIVLYNVVHASADSGPNIFGTEPWYYYFANLALNFNIALPLALAAPLALPFSSIKKKRQALLLLLPFFLWLAIFTAQPHKEERFMYIIYGALAVNAAVTVDAIVQVGSRVLPRWPYTGKIAAAAVLLVYAVLSIMRISALISYYGAPIHVYRNVPNLTPPVPTAGGGAYSNICVGREWYRFPSSYFLRDDQRLKFIASGFDGLLPGEFAEGSSGLQNWRSGTHVVPHGMNNRNKADPSKLVPVSACDYIVDTDLATAPGETRFTRDKEHWRKVVCRPFLDAGASRGLARQLKIPTALHKLTKSELVWTEYCLLERVNSSKPVKPMKDAKPGKPGEESLIWFMKSLAKIAATYATFKILNSQIIRDR
jgi:alpha-1,2-mannosyltransferase